MRYSVPAAVMLLTASLLLGWSAPAVAATAAPGQIITVQAATASSTTAKLDLWQTAAGGGYTHVAGPISAYVGSRGVGHAREGSAITPAGVFTLTQAFGNTPSNGTALPYFQAGPADWWDGLSGSARYNTHVHQSASPGGASENLYRAGAVYAHAVVIDYNRFPVKAGAGSAFFLHVSGGQPTAGCVSIPSAALNTVMRWLKPASHPVISIGVGDLATRLVRTANAAAAKHNPRGHLDSATPAPQAVRVVGWAADPDSAASALAVDVYVDGRRHGRFSTAVARPDVAAAMHAGPRQGYAVTVRGITRGRHTVCVYAINIKQGNANPKLGCQLTTLR